MSKSIKVVYNSFAVAKYPFDVKVGTAYECIKNKDKCLIKNGSFERVLDFEFVKNMFKPCDGYNWGMFDDKRQENIVKQAKQTKKAKTILNE